MGKSKGARTYIAIEVDMETAGRLQYMADCMGMGVSDLVVEALTAYMDNSDDEIMNMLNL